MRRPLNTFFLPGDTVQGSVQDINNPLIVFSEDLPNRNDADLALALGIDVFDFFGNEAEEEVPKRSDEAEDRRTTEARQFASFIVIAGIVVGAVILSRVG